MIPTLYIDKKVAVTGLNSNVKMSNPVAVHDFLKTYLKEMGFIQGGSNIYTSNGVILDTVLREVDLQGILKFTGPGTTSFSGVLKGGGNYDGTFEVINMDEIYIISSATNGIHISNSEIGINLVNSPLIINNKAGVNNEVLTSKGPNASPTWQALPGRSIINNSNISYSIPESVDSQFIFCDTTTGTQTLTLPNTATSTGNLITIKKIDGSVNLITVTTDTAIDGDISYDLSGEYESLTLICNGVTWNIIAHNL